MKEGMEAKKEDRKDRVTSFEVNDSCERNQYTSKTIKVENGDNDDKDPVRVSSKNESSFRFPHYGSKSGDGYILSKSEKIKERLQQSVREEVKEKIANILHEVEQLSDVEKLLLYLQLPTGVPVDDVLKQKSHNNPLGKKADIEVSQTCTWIQTHLMEDPNVSLPKQEVYEEYKSFCSANNLEPLCAADFGKVMKQVFPSVKPRRLGTRGNSRYCYSGLSKNLVVKSHTLPNICLNKETYNIKYKDTSDDDVHKAACQLVLEWAEKLLEEKFIAIKDLAWYLVDNLCVDSRSVAAFTLLFFNNVDQPKKGSQAANLLKQVCGNRKRETQIHLQRKLQEKELIKEQKKKVQEQRQLTKSIASKTTSRKSQRTVGKKAAISNQSEKQTILSVDACDSSIFEEKELQLEIDLKASENVDDTEGKLLHSLHSSKNPSSQHIDVTPKIEQSCDDFEIKQKIDKVPIPRKSTRTSTVCIPSAMPGIIAVSPVQITLLGPQTSSKSQKFEKKYKRIQPKSTVSKTANKNSTVIQVHNKRSNRRQANKSNGQKDKSSLWNQIDDISSEKSSEESNGTKIIPSPVQNSALFSDNVLSVVNGKSTFEVGSVESVLPVTYSDLDNNAVNLNTRLTFDNSDELSVVEQIKNDNTSNANFSMNRDKLYESFVNSDISSVSDALTTMKRHCDENDADAIASKKPLLENIFNIKNTTAYLPPWETKDSLNKFEQSNKLLTDSEIQEIHVSINDKQTHCNPDEVSIHQLETEALIEYLHDIKNESEQTVNINTCDKDMQQQSLSPNNQKQQSSNTATELTQLRMLLERNLPKSVSRHSASNLKNISNHPDTPEQSSISSVLSSHSDGFDVKNQVDEVNQIVLKESDSTVTDISNCNYDDKLVTVCWTEDNDQNIVLRKDTLPLSETQENEKLSEDQMISQIQNSLLSNENSDDLDIIGTDISQQAISVSKDNLNNGVSLNETEIHQLQTLCNTKRNNIYTQVPSIPPSPTARRLAFNFLPISPRQTPIMENVSTGSTTLASPIPTSQFIVTSANHGSMVSVAVGSSRPPSAASSPFVSPRGTPIPLSRSRHNSGQSAYSTPRQTPLQNFDSGVSSISTSPFISPQPTPLPLSSRLRHNSSHSQGRTVTFNTVGSPHPTYNQAFTGSRSRHNSGPGMPHQLNTTVSPRSAPLSPMVSECYTQNHFSFPCVGETPTLRSRHNSASNAAPLSPVSEQVNISSNNVETQINNDQFLSCDSSYASRYLMFLKNQEGEPQASTSTSNENNGEEGQYQQLKSLLNSKVLLPHGNNLNSKQQLNQTNLMTVHPELKQQWINNRQRHTSGPLLFQRSSHITDQSSQEIQLLLQNATCPTSCISSNRSQSVPPYQMIQNLINQYNPTTSIDVSLTKSFLTNSVIKNSLSLPSGNKSISNSSTIMESVGFVPSSITPEEIFSSQVADNDDTLVNDNQSQTWDNLNREMSGARRNITDILEQPQEDLEMTLDDLRDFDTDFSKLAQELEGLNPNDEGDLS